MLCAPFSLAKFIAVSFCRFGFKIEERGQRNKKIQEEDGDVGEGLHVGEMHHKKRSLREKNVERR